MKSINLVALTVLVVIIIAATLVSADMLHRICYGSVYDGSGRVMSAWAHCYHSDGYGGECGELSNSPTPVIKGIFHIETDEACGAGYYNVCIIKDTKWAHVDNIYWDGINAYNCGNVSLRSTPHPMHQKCRD